MIPLRARLQVPRSGKGFTECRMLRQLPVWNQPRIMRMVPRLLHELFDKINEDVEDYVDLVAERAVQLGGNADGTARMIVKRSSLAEYSASSPSGHDHVQALSSALAAFGKLARRAIDASNEVNDADTADIFTEISRGVDKWLWMVEAHLQL